MTRLRRLRVDEVSPVDRAANKRRFLIMKNHDGQGFSPAKGTPRKGNAPSREPSELELQKRFGIAMSDARNLAMNVAGHHAAMVEKRASERVRSLEADLDAERSKRIEAENQLALLKKRMRRSPPPAPSGLPHGEEASVGRPGVFSWGQDLAVEANSMDREGIL